jgi:hypothetical protein
MSREVMQQALDALELPCDRWNKQQHMIVMKASDALRAELAKPAGVSTRKVLEDLVLWVYANAHWGCTPLEVIYAQAALAKPEPGHAIQWDEDRMDTIGPNGNDGLHYDVP